MSRVYLETEHQELFFPDADLHAPIALHIPSALGQLGYFVCIRTDAAAVASLSGVGAHLKVAGLRPDDVTVKPGDGMAAGQGTTIPSTVDGKAWHIVARARVSRGDGVLTLLDLPASVSRADVLLCTWLRFLESGEADQWLACQADPKWAPNGVPLGGIGTGKVELSRDGRFRNFSGNNNQDMPFEEPDGLAGAYLSVRVGVTEAVLATRPVQGREVTLPPVPALHSDLAFPQVQLSAPQAVPGVDVQVVASGPTVPQDLATASLPGFILRWTITSTAKHFQYVRLRLAWPNLVGQGGGIGRPETNIGYADGSYRFWTAPDAPTATPITGDGWRALRYGNAPSPHSAAADGYHYIATRGEAGDASFHLDPQFGSVLREVPLAPGATTTVDMAVVWEMPHWVDTKNTDRGVYWQTVAADGPAILDRLFREHSNILKGAGALTAHLRGGDLPAWLANRLANSCYPLVSNSVLFRDGRFSINEGPTEMAGCYGTIDQRLGSHAATQNLFPSLNATELGLFGDNQGEDGGINHDLGHGHLERGSQPMNWPDLTCSFIIQHARHAWSTGDAAFEATAWPRCVKALHKHAAWADAGKGVAQVGKGLGTSYDGYHYEGTTPYMATLWLAALKTMRRWAARRGETDLIAKIDAWIPAAVSRMEADLWNGSFYRAYGSEGGRMNENCHAGMLAGEYYARLLAGEDVLPADRLASCANAWFSLNGSDAYQIPPDEVAPDGSAGSEYGWLPYVESFGLAPLAILGDPRVLPVFQRMAGHMSEHGRRPCDTRLMYQPVSGEISWGSYYMTAPASWLIYEALLDVAYTPGNGVLRLAPQLEGRLPIVHPRLWATVSSTADDDGKELTLSVVRTYGDGDLAVRVLEVPAEVTGVSVDGKALAAVTDGDTGARYRRFALPSALALAPGATLTWQLHSS